MPQQFVEKYLEKHPDARSVPANKRKRNWKNVQTVRISDQKYDTASTSEEDEQVIDAMHKELSQLSDEDLSSEKDSEENELSEVGNPPVKAQSKQSDKEAPIGTASLPISTVTNEVDEEIDEEVEAFFTKNLTENDDSEEDGNDSSSSPKKKKKNVVQTKRKRRVFVERPVSSSPTVRFAHKAQTVPEGSTEMAS